MTAFFKPTDTQGLPLNKIFAEDTNQLVNVLSGVADAGALSLLAPIATPSAAPTIALSAGGITGTVYQWGVYWITGIQDGRGTPASNNVAGRTPYGPLTVAQALSAQQATVTLVGTPPTGAIGWGVARNKSGGATWYTVPGSEQFLNAVGNMPASFVDNVSDASLVTLAPTVNTTGTTLNGGGLTQLYDTTVTGSSVASIDIQAITSFYRHLLIVFTGRSAAASATDQVAFRFNNDSGANYSGTSLYYNAGVSGNDQKGATLARGPFVAAASAAAGYSGGGMLWIPAYRDTTLNKMFAAVGGASADNTTDANQTGGAHIGFWHSTAAVNRVTMTTATGSNLDVGAHLTLYGSL